MKHFPALLLALAASAVTILSPTVAPAQPLRIPVRPVVKELRPSARAQKHEEVPASYRPPPGMCRIWLDSVPAGQQPAPTDCATAVRNRPANGRVLFGDDYVDGKDKGRDAKEKPRPAVPQRPRPGADTMPVDARHSMVPGVDVFGGYRLQPAAYVRQQDDPRARRAPARERARERDRQRQQEERTREARRAAAEERRLIEERRAERRRDVDDEDDDRRRDDPRGGDRRDGVQRGGDRVIVTGPGSDPRYYDERYGAPNRANGTCLDRNRDGWCDDSRLDAYTCLDRDGDGRCDDYGALATAPYASELPPMRAGADVRAGGGSSAALRWLGTAEVIARTTDLNRDGVPERVMWLDANNGQLVQVWTDRDRDGVADRVEVYRNGRRIKLFGR